MRDNNKNTDSINLNIREPTNLIYVCAYVCVYVYVNNGFPFY